MRRDIFNAISDPTRRNILISLTKGSENVNSLANQFDMTRQAVSLHVKYLKECGIITVKQEGRERYCNLKADKLMEVADWLEPFKQLWEKRFSKLDDLLENMKSIKKGKR